jgi:hypothetical protein
MFAFNPGNEDESGRILGGAVVGAANTTANAQMKLADDIGSSLLTLASAYGKKRDKKDMLAGMDQSVNAMSDIGAVTSDFRERYMNAPENVRPFLFEAVASPMLKSFSAGQSAAAQAQAWDKYNRNQGTGGGGPSAPGMIAQF